MVLEYLSRNRVARTLCLGWAPRAFPAEQVVLSLCSDSLQTERVWERISPVPGTNAESSQMLIQTTLLYGCVVSHCLTMYIRNDWTCRLRGLNPLIHPIACTLSAMMQLHGEGFESAFCRMEGAGLFPSLASVFRCARLVPASGGTRGLRWGGS